MYSEDHEFQRIFNQYVKHYNSKKNKITALSELVIVRQGVDNQVNNSLTKIEDLLGGIREKLNKLYNELEKDEVLRSPDLLVKDYRSEIISSSLFRSDKWISQKLKEINIYYEKNGEVFKENIFKKILSVLMSFRFDYLKFNRHRRALKRIEEAIINRNYPNRDLSLFEDLLLEEQEDLLSNEYTPHHNTREDLVKDLRKIINEVQNKPRFFHSDDIIKHTTVAKYAVSQDWFAEKHGHSHRGLHNHIKKLYKYMKST